MVGVNERSLGKKWKTDNQKKKTELKTKDIFKTAPTSSKDDEVLGVYIGNRIFWKQIQKTVNEKRHYT